MAHFYFHVHDRMNLIDKEGLELPDAEAAFKQGLRFAGQLISLEASAANQGHDWWMEIADDNHLVLFRIELNIIQAVADTALH